ncbi:PF06945 family protein [Leptospira fainei serovar Hurstbridge str. BUT 6]|uniref:PF06945 family protein n=1 Tax=Leptospira fainei serovar Hurstbridge str. BUT 6 TaxID=1193011 RepID=S3W2W1_9LEPT|nr:PF06945 family protein [Leptospira fainei serovar Hurstbridge str. BUT 6]
MIVRSPCIKLCQMDPITGLCEGCFRTLQEIGMWTSYSEEERKQIRIELQRRRESISPSNAS